jgi:CRP-like cAMP-binding protein
MFCKFDYKTQPEKKQNQMTEYQSLIHHLQNRIQLSDEEVNHFVSEFKITKVKKRQFIVQPDFVAKYRNYVVKGALRAYVAFDDGQEHTIAFAIEDWWISDYNSYIYQKPATMFVVALEDTIILQIDFETETKLKNANPKFETFFRITAERTAAAFQRRIIMNLTSSAEERYINFVTEFPLVVKRVPQYTLASYLGMTTEFLSKIRNNKLKNKS